MAIIKQSVTYRRAFFMVLSSDHITGATGKTVSLSIAKSNTGSPSFAGVAGAVAEVGNGWYYCTLDPALDINVTGDTLFHATAAGCDPTDWVDQVQTQIFPDLALNSSGQPFISTNIKQNVNLNGFMFTMTVNGTPTAGLTVTAQRSLGGAAFAPCGNAVTSVGAGIYSINLLSTDLSTGTVMLRFTAAGADDRNIFLVTQP